jgi:hypothetical protein
MAGSPQGGIPNVNQAAAQGIYGAGQGAAFEMGYAPQQVQAGQLATTDLSQYQNPYTQQVIDASAQDVLRNAQIGMQNLGAQAQAARAFGGSRHGIAQAEMGRGVADMLGQQSAMLRAQGFQNAQQAAQSDIANRFAADQFNVNSGLAGSQQRLAAGNQLGNVANIGFGMGQTINRNMMQQGALQQGIQQALIDAAKQQYAGYTNAPAQSINYASNALQAVPGGGGQTQTTSSSPGLFGMLSSVASMASNPAVQAAFTGSDENLKTDITLVGKAKNGIEIFTWKWNELAKKLGLNKNPEVGVIAQKVMKTHPDFVKRHKDGYLTVNYEVLNV